MIENLIGIGADGASANGNNLGVYLFNSPNNTIESNISSDNTTQGILIAGSGSSGNVVQDNNIGTTANGINASNGAQGVQLTFGAASNIIGSDQSSIIGGNYIYSDGAAVWATPNAGVANRILANHQIYSSSGGPPIDLGSAGATPNDAGDADTGPNNLQNYPVVLNVYRSATGEWVEGVLDSTANDVFRLDFYWAPCCSARGNATYFSGRGSSGMTDAVGHVHFWVKLPANAYPSTGEISGTATTIGGDTSESGEAAKETLNELIFRDDFESH